ncbi:hypothetical protein FACS1894176_04290 [Bacteroidia bacterium]|nr:hypothetical protein FACS1894176_04290 [Bacteroidia bacterium]
MGLEIERVLGMDTHFERYMSLLFRNIVLESKVDNLQTVIEFAPGFRTKGAYSLKKLNFEGIFYVIDTNKEVLNYIEKSYQAILPSVKIVCIPCSLSESIQYLPKVVDLFISNHPIDDMILYEFLGKDAPFAFNNTQGSKGYIHESWNKLKDNS